MQHILLLQHSDTALFCHTDCTVHCVQSVCLLSYATFGQVDIMSDLGHQFLVVVCLRVDPLRQV